MLSYMAIIRLRRPVHERLAGFDYAHLALPVVFSMRRQSNLNVEL